MATANVKRMKDIKRSENIKDLRNKINSGDPTEIHPFKKYKIITYLWTFIFAPYALYRVWCNSTEFNKTEKATQTLFICCYIYCLISIIF